MRVKRRPICTTRVHRTVKIDTAWNPQEATTGLTLRPTTAHSAPPSPEAKPFRLRDLPSEARIEIYKHALVKLEPIRLELRSGSKHGREIVNADHKRNYNHHHNGRFQAYDKTKGEWVDAPPIENAIIFVNKAICLEATAVLYGSNTFTFKTTTALDHFLDTIGMRAQHLRHVIVGPKGYVKSTVKSAMVKLAAVATDLRRIEFSHDEFCPYDDPKTPRIRDLVQNCAPLLRVLEKEFANRNVDVSQILQIGGEFSCCWEDAGNSGELQRCIQEILDEEQ
ncbi:hypothetical protein CB0940_03297 [Cercospora beticola]|uniref:DUF7730 domain-containing protein n=1 Tax=Cercospora beticola TaxID=122368 RepID=A0A2G5I1H3_CERBT|nr:hypothetical protein CB0940_03297 [Cercospora beticola]PIA98629.1 hypothetical protein CB0940_03297 [Cercospora beticola]WPB00473.1 hypothetical protein RHO25_005093 [Cercospora beticola]CAK1361312.1 unnamed protein product [Cercospora beticola]